MKTITITKTLYTYDELPQESKTRALDEFVTSPYGAQATYESYADDISESVKSFEDVTGARLRLGGGVDYTTCDDDFLDAATYADEFPDFSRDEYWSDYDISAAWFGDGETDVKKEFSHCAKMRDFFGEESDIFFGMYTDAENPPYDASTYLALSSHAGKRRDHYSEKMEQMLSDAASRVCAAVDALYEDAWGCAASEENFEETCTAYDALFDQSGHVYDGLW